MTFPEHKGTSKTLPPNCKISLCPAIADPTHLQWLLEMEHEKRLELMKAEENSWNNL